ncbi:hypothetical protein PISMIDRAFT_680096 [Pisolithus microcarpus 441]|uniref:Uncharacterized protein n=1 Tax=Pisolithus microcarpus 441 TaxID=765257 RepID=A0A0C9ZS01_9AGAM|nr:hypothetical protein PISMIDRAFT_680096 [Pisolithus microcarpus 441]
MVSVGGSTIRIASFPSGTRLLPPITQSCVFGVKFSPDSSRFATIAVRRGFRVYNTHDGVILFSSGPGDLVCKWPATNPLAWSSDSQHLFVANPGETTCLDLSKSSSSVWSIHETHPRVSLVSNGRFIACSAGSSVSFWDCVSHKQIDSMISHTTEIYCTALSPSGRLLACGGSKNVTIHRVRDVLSPEYFDHGLPLVQVSDPALKSWIHGDPANAEMLLSEEIASTSSPSHYVLANRTLIRVHMKQVALTIEDVRESLQLQPSPIGYITMAVALLAQGNREAALCMFDLAFHDCEPHENRFLLLLKSILVFECGSQEEAITLVGHLATRTNNDDDAIYLYTEACAHLMRHVSIIADTFRRFLKLCI